MVVSQACYQSKTKTAALARQVNRVYINNLLAATSFTQSSSLDIHSESSNVSCFSSLRNDLVRLWGLTKFFDWIRLRRMPFTLTFHLFIGALWVNRISKAVEVIINIRVMGPRPLLSGMYEASLEGEKATRSRSGVSP